MNPSVIFKHGRNLLSVVETNANRLVGRELVPLRTNQLSIEPTSVCNLECCFCAYTKKESPKVTMSSERFVDYIEQAVALGYRHFHLTPNTGDIFMDRRIIDKLCLLEQHPHVDGYHFFTNFTIPDAEDISRLVKLKKLKLIIISVYGHDRESFVKITKANDSIYRRLLTNLETMLPLVNQFAGVIEIPIRSTRDMPRAPESDLLKLLQRYRLAGISVKRSQLYHSWGGQITPEDTKGLAIDLIDSRKIYKNGACALLFTGVQIMATGLVHACQCVDVNGSLKIGDLNEKPLRDILSSKNSLYMSLIEEQQRGHFHEVCKSCGFYKSIYHSCSHDRRDAIPRSSIAEFKIALDGENDASRPR